MAYFKGLTQITYLVVIIMVVSPLVYVLGENGDTMDTDKFETTNDNTGINYAITIESANKEKISIVSDGALLGYTPYTLLMQYDAKVNLQCVSKDGRVLLNTTLEGGKSPQRILILPLNRDTYWKDVAMGICGISIGAGIGFAIALLFVDGID